MGKILCLADIHATRRPPSSCTADYWPDLLDLLMQSTVLAAERKVLAVVWAGDVFHHKAPSRTDHGLVQDLIRVIRAYPCPVFIVAGNHDMQHDRLASVEATQPLGVLYKAGAIALDGWADEVPLFGVPWQQRWSAAGIQELTVPWQDGAFGGSLVVTHAPIYPPAEEPRYAGAECTPAVWWASALVDGELPHGLFYGHVHEPHGVYEVEGVRFCNNGALSRGSLDEYNLHRPVGCTLWDTVTGAFDFVPLRSRPASEVFRLHERAEAVTLQGRLDDFLARAGATVLPKLSVEGVMAHIREKGLGPDVTELAEELLTEAAYEGKCR
jgi:DNA repair exonuclease SbcCD nuclease subunit